MGLYLSEKFKSVLWGGTFCLHLDCLFPSFCTCCHLWSLILLSSLLGAKKEEDDRSADVLDVADENFMLKTDKIVSVFELGWEVLKAVRVAIRELRR